MQAPVLFDMVDHPDAQEELMNSEKPGNSIAFHNELIALLVLLSILVVGVVAYLVFRSMVYMKKEKAQERLPINSFGQIHLP